MDTAKYKVYSDIPGHMTGYGTIPPEICITNGKPDIVIIDEKRKTLDIFELTVPFEKNIEERNTLKNNKAFEVGSRGYISPANKKRLGMLQKFLKAGNPIAKFQKNVSALSVYSSYYIFLCRKDPAWSEPNFLAAPFV